MNKLIFSILLLGLAIVGFADQSRKVSALQSMVDTERAFARMSEEKGTRPAFMAFIAEDGILFRPRAVKGKQWMTEHPLPPSEKQPLLKWQPGYADMAGAGDMGYTFGPWEFKTDVKDARAVGFGHFVTIWKKQTDGSWKFAVDLGISHPEPTQAAAPWELPKSYKQPTKVRLINVEAERATLLARERDFSNLSASSGAQEAFLANAATDVRVFREGKTPLAGKTRAAEAIPASAGLWTWQPEAWDVSSTGDLGYSYGTYRLKSNDSSAKTETGNYFRIWKKQNNKWEVVVDLANPVPEQ